MVRRLIISSVALAVILLGLFAHYLLIGSKVGQETRERHPERYGSMRVIETGDEYWVMVDTETGCCYLFSRRGGVVQLTNYDGSPHLANGWRDVG